MVWKVFLENVVFLLDMGEWDNKLNIIFCILGYVGEGDCGDDIMIISFRGLGSNVYLLLIGFEMFFEIKRRGWRGSR